MINLKNGEFFDADKFDYILRNTWSTGMSNTSIDIHRLISALVIELVENKYSVCFKSSALDIVNDFIRANDNIKNRIQCHHTVVYYQNSLKFIVNNILHTYGIDEEGKKSIFSFETFSDHVIINDNDLYLVDDGDILYLLKKYSNPKYSTDTRITDFINEILSRKPQKFLSGKHLQNSKIYQQI